nr:hypothetical protein NG677_04500 [Methylobacterium sp. OTU13CASTA1]
MTMPSPELRDDVHALLDDIWINAADTGGYHGRSKYFLIGKGQRNAQRVARDRVYAWLAEQMWLTPRDCHVTRFTVDQYHEAICLLHGTTYAEIRAWAKRREADRAYAEHVERRAAA